MMRPSPAYKNLQRNIAANLVGLATLILADSSQASLTLTTANQQGSANTYPFTPTWTPALDSLILGLAPSMALGNFGLEAHRNILNLTAGGSLTIDKVIGNFGQITTSTNYVTCGQANGAGSLLVYTLPASANGYDLTNITVYGGWVDSGRDGQAFTVLYSTAANPGNFIYLTTVNYNPSVPYTTASANREVISDSLGGVIAANVAAVEFDFTNPQTENGYTGYGAITVEGMPASSVLAPVVSILASNQSGASPYTPTWTAETPDLIAGLTPTSASGNFTQEGSGGVATLTDGVVGQSGNVSGFATCGTNGGMTLIYTLTNVVAGTDVTNIVVYSGWGDASRDGQYYILSYSTVAAPDTYDPITTVYYNPQGVSRASVNRVAISASTGVPLARGVANLKFDFASSPAANQFDHAYCGISEIIVQGIDTMARTLPDTLPAYAETVVGDQVVFTVALSNVPPATLQWLFINGGVTSPVPGATNSIFTLNDVQLTNSGYYQLEAVNGAEAPCLSRAAQLVVGNLPAPVNNVIMEYAGQCGAGGVADFCPTWSLNINNDLIFGFPANGSGNPGTATGSGDFSGGGVCNPDPTILEDGAFGCVGVWPGPVNLGEVACGPTAGQSMIYFLITNSAPDGFDLTNITVYGGWADSGRNEQKYQVLYSTMANPTVFNLMASVDYNPSDPDNTPSATRTTLIPSGVMARNVRCVEINWNLQAPPPKNGFEGYSEILISGTNSPRTLPLAPITPVTAEDVEGSSLVLEGGLSGAANYQWQKNGTNIPGATSTTLTLSHLRLTDTATNGGYRLVASNVWGNATTRECALIVDPAPSVLNNLIMAFASQTSDQTGFSPTWDMSALSSSLIYRQNPPGGGYGTGNFNDPYDNPNGMNNAGGLPVLTDGNYGVFTSDGSHPAFATCGSYAGQYVIYTLGNNASGYDITNIQIAGGWNDSGRDAQWYTVSYSTVANPTTFIPIAVVTNNPPMSDQSVIRTTITPVTGFIATNAYAVYVDFTTPPGVPNGYSGYNEISILGSPAPNSPALKPARLSDGNLIITGTGGTPNYNYTVLMTTNLATPLASWTVSASGVTDGAGAFSNAIPVNPSQPDSFFQLRMP